MPCTVQPWLCKGLHVLTCSEKSHGRAGCEWGSQTLLSPLGVHHLVSCCLQNICVLGELHLLALGGYLLFADSAGRKESRRMNASKIILLAFPGKGMEISE